MTVNVYLEDLTRSFDQQIAEIFIKSNDTNKVALFQETFSTYKEGIRYYVVTYLSHNFKYRTDPSTMMNEMQQLQDIRASVSLPSFFNKDMENIRSLGFNLPTPQDV